MAARFILLTFLCSSIFANEALDRLIEGNNRYVNDKLLHPNRTSERREAIISKQKPFAIILGCSDSRVSPEILFDEGVGDLFVVRVAGNVVGPIELESIDYGALYLKSSVIMVLGHQNCGAVDAVLEGNTKDIPAIAKRIEPAVKIAKKEKGNTLENAIQENVRLIVKQLKQTKSLSPLVRQKKLEIVGGYYDLETGKVQLL